MLVFKPRKVRRQTTDHFDAFCAARSKKFRTFLRGGEIAKTRVTGFESNRQSIYESAIDSIGADTTREHVHAKREHLKDV